MNFNAYWRTRKKKIERQFYYKQPTNRICLLKVIRTDSNCRRSVYGYGYIARYSDREGHINGDKYAVNNAKGYIGVICDSWHTEGGKAGRLLLPYHSDPSQHYYSAIPQPGQPCSSSRVITRAKCHQTHSHSLANHALHPLESIHQKRLLKCFRRFFTSVHGWRLMEPIVSLWLLDKRLGCRPAHSFISAPLPLPMWKVSDHSLLSLSSQ